MAGDQCAAWSGVGALRFVTLVWTEVRLDARRFFYFNFMLAHLIELNPSKCAIPRSPRSQFNTVYPYECVYYDCVRTICVYLVFVCADFVGVRRRTGAFSISTGRSLTCHGGYFDVYVCFVKTSV